MFEEKKDMYAYGGGQMSRTLQFGVIFLLLLACFVRVSQNGTATPPRPISEADCIEATKMTPLHEILAALSPHTRLPAPRGSGGLQTDSARSIVLRQGSEQNHIYIYIYMYRERERCKS